ncbi:hypothetical protein Mapa_012157 [Marchantia paleacea]|nr:hypothetical protein Mapa_012157 [Marchantia paleacea]
MPLNWTTHCGSKRASEQQLHQSFPSNKKQCFWPCPLCNRSFASFLLDDHISDCLESSLLESSQPKVKPGNAPADSSRDIISLLQELVDVDPSAPEVSETEDTGDLQVGVSTHIILCESAGQMGQANVAIKVDLDVQVQDELHKAELSSCNDELGRSKSTIDTLSSDIVINHLFVKEEISQKSCQSGEAEPHVRTGTPVDLESIKLALRVESPKTASEQREFDELSQDGNGRVVERPPPGFKLYQRQKQSQPKLSMFFKQPASAAVERKPSVSVLQPGMILFKNWLDLEKQQHLVQESHNVAHLFHRPVTSGGGKYHIYSMCWGPKWNPKTHRYAGSGAERPLPDWMFDLAQKVCKEAQQYTSVHPADVQFSPDVALVNFYPVKDVELGVIGLGGHQDLDDSCTMPVVSMSLGDSMTFFYRRIPPLSRRKSKIYTSVDEKAAKSCEDGDVSHNREQQIILNSGDVLVFGGESRLIYHGTRHVQAGTRPPGLHMVAGRLNFTFRQTDASLNAQKLAPVPST